MARDVAEALARDGEELGDVLHRKVGEERRLVRDRHVDLHAAVASELGGEVLEAVRQVAGFQEHRSQAEDEVADVADHRMERVDRCVHPAGGLLGVLIHQLGHVVERQRLRIDRLDHAVMEVPADAVALVDDGEPA